MPETVLTVSRLGTTAIFSDGSTEIARIAADAAPPSQTITYSDGTHIELTYTDVVLAGVVVSAAVALDGHAI